jgi:hypothetical protein
MNTDENLPSFAWRMVTRALLERPATRRIEVVIASRRFIVERVNPGTYVVNRRDGRPIDGNPAKTAIGTKELKRVLIGAAFHDHDG